MENNKYKLILDRYGLVSKKTEYEEGEEVEVTYPLLASDTDYRFHIDVERFKQDYDPKKGIILNFVMPDHDVKVSVTSRNTMMRDPNIAIPGIDITDKKDPGELCAGEWRCPECGMINSGKYCSECGSKRPGEQNEAA